MFKIPEQICRIIYEYRRLIRCLHFAGRRGGFGVGKRAPFLLLPGTAPNERGRAAARRPIAERPARSLPNYPRRLSNSRQAYTVEKVLAAADNYVVKLGPDSKLLGVVEVRAVQWYQCEIDHLSVQENVGRKGIGSSLLKEAEARVVELGRRIAQCTIRIGNEASEGLFKKFGYAPTVTFFNKYSGNNVTVYQKALVTARG